MSTFLENYVTNHVYFFSVYSMLIFFGTLILSGHIKAPNVVLLFYTTLGVCTNCFFQMRRRSALLLMRCKREEL